MNSSFKDAINQWSVVYESQSLRSFHLRFSLRELLRLLICYGSFDQNQKFTVEANKQPSVDFN